jgi:transcriptional regulator with XRE-family HTH domain
MRRKNDLGSYSRQLGAYVRRLRRAAGLTQEQIAERADVSPSTVQNLELSRFSPSVETLRKIAQGLGLTPGALLTQFEDHPTSSGEMAVVTIYRRSDPLTREAIRASVQGLGQLSELAGPD